MVEYPSIDGTIQKGIYVIFKSDWSNCRAEWSRKQGFYKFGSRTQLIDDTNSILGKAPELFMEKYSESLSKKFKDERWEKATVFFEFAGPKSEFGWHDPEDVFLFDIHKYKLGFLLPQDFIKFTRGIDVVPVLYEGNSNSTFIESVKNNSLPGLDTMSEGVVCKGNIRDKRQRVPQFKVKCDAWIQRLHRKCKDDEKLFQSLL